MRVLVTGGASGLGKAIVTELASHGHEVWFTYCRSEGSAREILNRFPSARASRCDFSDPASLKEFVLQVRAAPSLDALVNNAFTGLEQTHFQKRPAGHWSESFGRNVVPVLQVTQEALGLMRKQKRGRVCTILTSYLSGKVPAGLSTYVAEKAYLLSMSRSWAAENAAYGIQSSCVSPSFLQTPLNAGVDERVLEGLIAQSPGGRLLTVEEVATQVRSLLEDPAAVSGQNILMEGGARAL